MDLSAIDRMRIRTERRINPCLFSGAFYCRMCEVHFFGYKCELEAENIDMGTLRENVRLSQFQFGGKMEFTTRASQMSKN
jgi:hypothetical protein